MHHFQKSCVVSQVFIECELNDKFRRKEIIKKIKSEKSPVIEIEISCLKYYDKLEEHLNEIFQTNPTSISILSIILNEIKLTDKVYNIIAQNICKFSNLKELNIELSQVGLQDLQFQSILYEMVDLDLLKSLSIDISNNQLLTNNIAQFLGLTISQLTKLEKVAVNVSQCILIENRFIDKYSQLTKRMISVKDISLHLSSTGILDFKFLGNIGEVQNLQNLSISFNFNSVDSEKSFLENLNIFQAKIKSLSLYLQGSYFNEDFDSEKYFFKQFGQIINESKYLKELFLNCENQESKMDISKLYENMPDKIIQGLNLYVNIDDEEYNSTLLQIAKEQHHQLLRIIILQRQQNYFTQFLQLLD